VKILTKTTFRG